MPIDSISIFSNTFYMLSASTMTLCNHFDSTSEPEPQSLSQVMWVKLFKTPFICPWTAYQCAQTRCICLMWMHRKQFKLAVILNHDIMTSFWLHKWAWSPKSEQSSVGIPVWGYCHIPMDSISMLSNTLYKSNVDEEAVWAGCQPQQWHNDIILTQQTTQNPKIWPNK